MPQDQALLDFFKVLFGAIILAGIVGVLKKVFTKFDASSDHLAKLWAKHHLLSVFTGINTLRYEDRFDANPGKTFFDARKVINSNEQTFFAEGQIQKRHVWLYRITGRPPFGSGLGTTRSKQTTPAKASFVDVFTDNRTETISERVFYGWCLEIETKHIPQTVTITKKFINKEDVLDTESNTFEKKYDISNTTDSLVLQLLDPVLIERVHDSQCSAIEISDASILLYFTLSDITLEVLDALLQNGIHIAEQVDQNFPLAKKSNQNTK